MWLLTRWPPTTAEPFYPNFHSPVNFHRERDGQRARLFINESQGIVWQRSEDLLALDEALSQLEQISPRASEIVELRFLCGFAERETAEALDISVATLKRDWAFAKGFIYRQLTGGQPEGEHSDDQTSLSTMVS